MATLDVTDTDGVRRVVDQAFAEMGRMIPEAVRGTAIKPGPRSTGRACLTSAPQPLAMARLFAYGHASLAA